MPSPNIWNSPAIYELENRAADPDGRIEAAMREIHDWAGGVLLDVGCGTGYHLPRFARTARTVIGVEPHERLATLARRRATRSPGAAGLGAAPGVAVLGAAPGAARAGVALTHNAVGPLGDIHVRVGTAQSLPVPDASVDVAHARWAYFFGPGCEPGLAELRRVLRRGGTAFVIDNDATTSTFGGWFRRWLPSYDPTAVERFWAVQGFNRRRLEIRWAFERREDLAAVLRIEFPAELAERFLAEHAGLEVDYAVNLWWA